MLTDRDIAGLTNRLQVPVVAGDILEGAKISDEMRYGLHEVLSEMQPDSALLAIALGAQKIAQRYLAASPSLAVLTIETDRIIEDYAGLWLDNARNVQVDEEDALERLAHVPEDLQSLSELLESAAGFLQYHSSEVAELCRILMVQADAHTLIAESFAEAIEYMPEEEAELSALPANDAIAQVYAEEYKAFVGMEAATYSDNVIQFPGSNV